MNIDILLAGFDAAQIKQVASVPWLVIGLLAFSAAVGVYNFLQMRKMQKKNQPKPNQLDGTIADEGTSFCDIAGSPHVHANITDIWGKSTQAIKKKSGGFLGIGKTSQVTGYRYYAKFAAFIGNRIEKLIAINFDNRKWVVHDPVHHPVNMLPVREGNLFGENEGGVAGDIDIHFGYPDQEPNLEYQKHFPLVSGYPYQSYLLFRGYNFQDPFLGHTFTTPAFYLGNSGYMKEMLLWVKRTRVRNDGRVQWHEVRGDGAIVCEIGAELGDGAEIIGSNRNSLSYERYYEFTTSSGSVTGGSFSRDVGYVTTYDYSIQISHATMSGNNSANPVIPHALYSGTIHIKEAGSVTLQFRYNQQDNAVLDLVYSAAEEIGQWIESETFEITVNGVGTVTDRRLYRFVRIRCYGNSSITYSLSHQAKLVGKNSSGKDVYGARFNLFIYSKFEAYVSGGTPVDGLDINPIHKIREILTDDTAMGKPESDVNDATFIKAADRIWDEGLGISWAIDEKSCIEAIEELCYHIEAGIRVNRQTGLYEMVLFRDDWFSEDEIHYIAENKIKDLSLEVMNSDDIVNQLNVTYYDRDRIKNSTFSVYENGSILTMGHANAESVEFPYFMNMRNAEIVANWKLKQFSTPAWSGSFTTGWREARKWNRYDLIRLPWSSKWNGTILVRIMKINLGNGVDNTVTIDFEEVIPYSGEMNTSIVVDNPVDSGPKPPQPSVNAVFEAPYYLTVLRAGQTNADLELSNNPDIGYVAAIAAKPQSNSLNALLYTDGGAGEFEQVSRLDYCDILQLDQPITETTSSFVVTGSLTQTANSNNFIMLNDELMGFVSFDDETKVLTVKRGVLDTVPKKHNSGDLFVFDLPDVAFDSTQYAQSEIIEAQVLTTTPSGIQELSSGIAVEIQSRAIRPYPPANVKINGEYFPVEIAGTLTLSWAHRNRVQQTTPEILGWYEPSVTLEGGATYTVNVYDTDTNTLFYTEDDIDLNETEISSFNAPENAKLELFSVRDDWASYQKFVHEFKWGAAKWNPSNLLNQKTYWLDTDSEKTITGGRITQWKDRSGANRNFTQSSTSLAPTPVLINGKQAVKFDSGTFLSSSDLSVSNNANATWGLFVYKLDTAATGARSILYVSANTATGRVVFQGGAASLPVKPNIYVRNSDSGELASLSSSHGGVDEWIIMFAQVDFVANTAKMVINGQSSEDRSDFNATVRNLDNTNSQGIRLGANMTGGFRFNGSLAAMIVGFNSTVDSSDIDKLMGWAAWKYDLVAKLPVDHPYKDAPP